ncbi:MAG TPA: hypothetical protein V6C91_09830 [Coleofasciculaceae cyanobacterium]
MANRPEFFSHQSNDYNSFTPENIVFDANLREFTQRVNYICYLQKYRKLSPEEVCEEIRSFLQELERSKEPICREKYSQNN